MDGWMNEIFFVWKRWAKSRISLTNELLALHFIHIIDAHLLLWGIDDSLTSKQNNEIFKTVQIFLSECGRFTKMVKFIM